MAVTYIQEPSFYAPSDSPLVWAFESTNFTQANFSFIITLFVNAQSISVHQIFAERGGKAHFDASEIIRSLIKPMQVIDYFESSFDANNFKNVYISIQEKYGTTPTIQPTFYNSQIIRSFKASLDSFEFSNFNYLDYTAIGVGKSFLTDKVDRIILPNSSTYFSYFAEASTTSYFLFETYDENRNFLDAYSTPVTNVGIKTVNVSLEQIYFLDNGVLLDPIHYIDVSVQELITGGNTVIQKYTVQIWRECSNGATLYWINRFGAVDSFALTHNVLESVEIDSFTFQKQFGKWKGSGSSYQFDPNDSGVIGLQRNMMDKFDVSSGWITESQQHFLLSACESPATYLKINDLFIRGNVKNSNYEKGQMEYEELLQVNLSFMPSNIRKSIVL